MKTLCCTVFTLEMESQPKRSFLQLTQTRGFTNEKLWPDKNKLMAQFEYFTS